MCTDPKATGHRDRYASASGRVKAKAGDNPDSEREADKKARALIIENNKAWKAAREVRSAWVKTFLARKTLSASAGPFLAVALTRDADISSELKGHHSPLGCPPRASWRRRRRAPETGPVGRCSR